MNGCPVGKPPRVMVTARTGGTENFVLWAVRDGALRENDTLAIDYVNVRNTQSYVVVFDWFAYCPN
ncbi:MAG: hypothetical protein OXU20_02755 [Myxococcales bacterium]|nr:hypothetical protein [Myxococcales bacterium]